MTTNSLLQAEAQAALDVGVAITSASNPSLNSTYPTDEDSQRKLLATFAYIAAFGVFPAGHANWSVRDITGISHVFSSVAQFQSFCRAVADYTAQLYLIIDGIDTTSTALPAPPPPIV